MTGIDLALLLDEEPDTLSELPREAPGPPMRLFREPSEADWQDDPLPEKLDKIRAAFLNAKTADEVSQAAGGMVIGDWLEMVVKLSPKNIQVQGALSFKHMLEELGPIDRDAYRLPARQAEAITVEYQEVKP